VLLRSPSPEDRISEHEVISNFDEARLMAKMVTRLIQCLSWSNARGEYHAYECVSFEMDTILNTLPNDKFPISLYKVNKK